MCRNLEEATEFQVSIYTRLCLDRETFRSERGETGNHMQGKKERSRVSTVPEERLITTVVNRPRFGRYSLGYVIQLDCIG
jgi:hypothetical protein